MKWMHAVVELQDGNCGFGKFTHNECERRKFVLNLLNPLHFMHGIIENSFV